MEFKNCFALVTGATRGIGQAILMELGQRGAKIVGTATSEEGAGRITQACKEKGLEGFGLCLNVTDSNSIEAGLKSMQERYGAPHILVNNAGITRDNLMLRMKEEEWQATIDTDLTSLFRVTKPVYEGCSNTASVALLISVL